MNSRERIGAIIARRPADHTGFWLGNPHSDTWPLLHSYFGTTTEDELRRKLGDDFAWITPQYMASTYGRTERRRLFDARVAKKSHGEPGPFASCEDPREVDDYPWPDPTHLFFDECLERLANAGDVYRASGFWTPFWHDVMDLFGMDNYLIKMYTHPEVVQAVTDRVCGFYYEANQSFFKAAGPLMDGFFFGNDFGTQREVICGPKQFDRFVLPWFRRFTDLAHAHNYQVILHSCGSIFRVIGRLVDSGVDCLHPLQALAHNMDAETLAREFGGKITFLGGIDTQQLLVSATPDEVKAEVYRVRRLLGPHLIVSPSHEALLPNVPPENVQAMAEAACGPLPA